ncbi:bifunctional proline dehydrogenase/L-glutamate gamma-semialdehyde dehydrogenase PutA [Gallaecimonas kandeliae]|uniref:bifunctional proline dehydrogenase/L-glutamate gamma-semialdehyde dehydrogenase PutA n=1 Tax=Gallaecimonas kandeliae TaxID=3029055 RepID=UPI0026474A60|nr:bifunctional proline dehydrogenase/L-glutamate gamma-semialdehyde dehydrogenase PutA [Gallaecimonas kandeliae]WKE64758.1 bifunctional proline dehydrogenase/L-glutamate gamma-semialdehyde dehydrogenase PutA [Gallaecimonas kandeliae]
MFNASQVVAPDFQVPSLDDLRQVITDNYAVDEESYLTELLKLVPKDEEQTAAITAETERLVTKIRSRHDAGEGIQAFLQQYSLDTQEGIILMCLAEALLRIPDPDTADALIKDKLSGADWARHFNQSESLLVNASTWGLMLTGKVITMDKRLDGSPANLLNRMITRLGEPVVRKAMYAAMKIMGKQFVLGRTIGEALKNSRKSRKMGYTHSYDMLGEAALTGADAKKYFDDYSNAIAALGAAQYDESEAPRPTISIKLSALHPRYDVQNLDRVRTEMVDIVRKLVEKARAANVGLQIDAEEADRLEISLDIFEAVYRSEAAKGWGNFGLVVQAFSKRALPVLLWLTRLGREQGDLIPVRLVKGAYWDTEIKLCQAAGLEGYPVYTRKASTDASYLACARFLLSEHTQGVIYPQFASHNAQTVIAIKTMAAGRPFEYQRLWGMGDELYDTVLEENKGQNVRIYAPVGSHKDLLPYLVRRLLENGANSSFVHKLVDPKTPVSSLATHPLKTLAAAPSLANHKIPMPAAIYGTRKNSGGINLHIQSEAKPFFDALEPFKAKQWQAAAIVGGKDVAGEAQQVLSPQNHEDTVGTVAFASEATVKAALDSAHAAFPAWCRTNVEDRAKALEKFADLMEEHRAELIALVTREAGRILQDGIDEVREAVDFCRYYAQQARKMFNGAEVLPGPTGELNELYSQGKGVFVCISPWNFPLAIFVGQVAAALATGNTVLAKPAEQTCLVAYRAIQLALEAGIPANVLHFLPGTGATVGAALTSDDRIAGVVFTGSTATAKAINKSLADHDGAIKTLIAETGGQNAMIVDSTALPEQVVKDVIGSAFTSAGQRCSALRVLYVQADVADRILELLKGAMQELVVADPWHYKTDIGPVIDHKAKALLEEHLEALKGFAKPIATAPMTAETAKGSFVVPTAVEISGIEQLHKENFGPILHVVRFQAEELDKVIDAINGTGYGLTLGVHSRNEGLALAIADKANVGNCYINRNQIGAMVGTQPFGGQGLSGTGPKAGGPHYLYRFVTEKTRTNNITAVGGNATLLTLGE